MIKSDCFFLSFHSISQQEKNQTFPFFFSSCFKNNIQYFFVFPFSSSSCHSFFNVLQPFEFYIHICISVYVDENLHICENRTFFFRMKANWRVDVTSQKISFVFLSVYICTRRLISLDTLNIPSYFFQTDLSCMWVSLFKTKPNHSLYQHTLRIDVSTCHFNFPLLFFLKTF